MNHTATPGELSTLDQILAAVDTRRRPADFGIVFDLKNAPTLDALRAGARSARNLYPVSGSKMDGNRWARIDVSGDGVVSTTATINTVELFLSERIDIRKQAPIQQLLVTGVAPDTPGYCLLVTHVHHAAADGMSVAMWLHHQLRVAAGLEPPRLNPLPFEPVVVRHHPAPIRKRSAHRGTAQCLWTRARQSTGLRRWMTIQLPALPLDALTAAAYETLTQWNRIHGVSPDRIGLWLPVNIRQSPTSTFGNGTSRIRIHPVYPNGTPFSDKCREIRRQIHWSLRHGEWALPTDPSLMRLPCRLRNPLLNLYLNRPWADMGTIAFSVAENWSGRQDAAFDGVEQIECVGQLHERHALVINGVRHGDRTWLTFTYDPGRLTLFDVQQLTELYREHLDPAERMLA